MSHNTLLNVRYHGINDHSNHVSPWRTSLSSYRRWNQRGNWKDLPSEAEALFRAKLSKRVGKKASASLIVSVKLRQERFQLCALTTYGESLDFLRSSLDAAKLGGKDKLDGFRRLDSFVRTVETELRPKADFDAIIDHETAIFPSLKSHSFFENKARQRQLKIF